MHIFGDNGQPICSPELARVGAGFSGRHDAPYHPADEGQGGELRAAQSGFYSGKRDNRVIDLQNFEANLSKLENFCYEESLKPKRRERPLAHGFEDGMMRLRNRVWG